MAPLSRWCQFSQPYWMFWNFFGSSSRFVWKSVVNIWNSLFGQSFNLALMFALTKAFSLPPLRDQYWHLIWSIYQGPFIWNWIKSARSVNFLLNCHGTVLNRWVEERPNEPESCMKDAVPWFRLVNLDQGNTSSMRPATNQDPQGRDQSKKNKARWCKNKSTTNQGPRWVGKTGCCLSSRG